MYLWELWHCIAILMFGMTLIHLTQTDFLTNTVEETLMLMSLSQQDQEIVWVCKYCCSIMVYK